PSRGRDRRGRTGSRAVAPHLGQRAVAAVAPGEAVVHRHRILPAQQSPAVHLGLRGHFKPIVERFPGIPGQNGSKTLTLPRTDGTLLELLEAWCSGLTCSPVKAEIAGSNPVASARDSGRDHLVTAGFA